MWYGKLDPVCATLRRNHTGLHPILQKKAVIPALILLPLVLF
jgi:hypothetical protein